MTLDEGERIIQMEEVLTLRERDESEGRELKRKMSIKRQTPGYCAGMLHGGGRVGFGVVLVPLRFTQKVYKTR